MRNTLFLILLSVVSASNAQTYFYRLSTVVENDGINAGNGTGLFITFIDGGCYDSDSEGCTMNHGLLKLHYKGNDKILYNGESYWGTAEYVFSSDYELLNVRAGDCVYIYKKSGNPTQRVSTYCGAKAVKNYVGEMMPVRSSSSMAADIKENDEYRGKLSPERYREHYANFARQAESLYNDLVYVVKTGSNDEIHINKYKAHEAIFFQSGMRELLIRTQAEMRNVRSEAAFYGVTIMQSRWETCSPHSRY